MSAGNEREFIDFQQNKEKGGRSMKCPMLTMYATSFKPPEEFKDRDCLKEECAWWDEKFEQCGIKTVLCTLVGLDRELVELVAKMPHEEQFKK